MKENFFKEWLNAIVCPMPVLWATKESWEDFAEKATFHRVRKAFALNSKGWKSAESVKNLRVVAKRLALGNWPKVNEDFLVKHQAEVLQVDAIDDLYHLESTSDVKPCYLIDKSNQLLGIYLGDKTVVTSVVNNAVWKKISLSLMNDGILPTKVQMELIGKHLIAINRLLRYLALEQIDTTTNYWVGQGITTMVWGFPRYCRPATLQNETGNLLFVADL